MFPDSCIALNYQKPSTKVMCVIKHCIGVHVKNALMKEINGRTFTYHFDETTI